MSSSSTRPASSSLDATSWFPSDDSAIRAAREEVKSLFRTSDQLVRIQPYLQECLRKKAAIESQLSSAVRTQVDETRLGLQLLQDSSTMMVRMRNNFTTIDAYCRDCKLVLRDSPEIARVNTVRKNLDATTRLLDKFRSLPEQAEALIDMLNDDDHTIKLVYKSLRRLFHLRDTAMDQSSGNASGGVPGLGIGIGGGGFSREFLSQLKENFQSISSAAVTLEERIWENISDAPYLAKNDPVTLVRTLEVVEMEDKAMRKCFVKRKDEQEEKEKERMEKEKEREKEEREKEKGKKGKKDEKKDKKDKEKEKDKSSSNAVSGSPSSTTDTPTTFLGSSTMTMREKCLNTLEKSIADLFQHLHVDEEQQKEQKRREEWERQEVERKKEERKKAELQARLIAQGKKPSTVDEVDEPEDEPSPRAGGGGLTNNGKGGLFHQEDDRVDGPSDYILTILEELKELVTSLPSSLNTLLPCFPSDYHLTTFYLERYKRWLKLTLSFHTNDIAKLGKKSHLKTVMWIEWYRQEVRKWEKMYSSQLKEEMKDFSEKELREITKKDQSENQYYESLIRDLMKYYTITIEDTLVKLTENIFHMEITSTPELNSEGFYVTSGPPELFYTINSTIEIVLSNFGLNTKPLSYVCSMLSRIFEHYQNLQLEFLHDVQRGEKDLDDQLFFGQDSLHKTDTYFSAVINNATRSQEYMDELKDKILERMKEAEVMEEMEQASVGSGANAAGGQPNAGTNANAAIALLALSSSSSPTYIPPSQQQHSSSSASKPPSLYQQMEDLFEESGEGFVTVASEGIDLLVLQISITLQKPMSNLFTPSWLKDSGVTDDIVLTLQDFMSDYKKWIGRDAYFSRMLIKCLHSVIAEYLRILTLTKPQVSTQLFERLRMDKNIFQTFFLPYTYEENGGLLPAALLKNELKLLTLVNKVVHEDVDFMSVHFDKIITRFGASAGEVMEGLIAMRTDLSRSQRHEVMTKFQEKLPKLKAEEALEKQLVAQNVAAMSAMSAAAAAQQAQQSSAGLGVSSSSTSLSSPRPPPKNKRGAQNEEDGTTSIKSFWDRFTSRKDKDKDKDKKKAVQKRQDSEVDGGTLQNFMS